MLAKFALVIVGILCAFAGVVTMQPDTYRVVRGAEIAAPPAHVFELINDFHKWNSWSPWASLDPQMKTEFAGPPSGTGAVYYWVGDSKVGEGRMTITDSRPPQNVKIRLEFMKPFASVALTDFAIKPTARGAVVQWEMAGNSDFLSKAMCLFMGGMDKMIGPDFERGLIQMKAVAEKSN